MSQLMTCSVKRNCHRHQGLLWKQQVSTSLLHVRILFKTDASIQQQCLEEGSKAEHFWENTSGLSEESNF